MKERDCSNQNQTLITNSTLKKPSSSIPTFKPSFPLPYLSFLPSYCYIKIKKAPIIHHHPWAIIHHPSSSKAPRKPVTFQNTSVISVGTMTDLHYWMIASKNNKHPQNRGGGREGQKGKEGGGGGKG
jgi:hypothetical protein